jgi:phosphomevalonate kinase
MSDILQFDSRREEHAKRLLTDELLNEAFEVLKKDLLDRWSASGSTEVEARESIWLAMRLLDKIHGHITSIVETGHMNKILDKQHPFI